MSLIQQKPKFVEVTTDSEILRSQLNEALVGRDLVKINDIEYVCFSGDGFNRFSLSEFRRVCASSPEKAEWTGEGLPPVGTVCEASSLAFPAVGGGGHAIFGGGGGGGEHFIKCTVIVHAEVNGAQVAVVNSGKQIGWTFIGKFRPIKTPEQIAADERANEVRSILDAMPHDVISGHTGAIVEWMLADGYRKSEIMDN